MNHDRRRRANPSAQLSTPFGPSRRSQAKTANGKKLIQMLWSVINKHKYIGFAIRVKRRGIIQAPRESRESTEQSTRRRRNANTSRRAAEKAIEFISSRIFNLFLASIVPFPLETRLALALALRKQCMFSCSVNRHEIPLRLQRRPADGRTKPFRRHTKRRLCK